jgi:hypothetical protein
VLSNTYQNFKTLVEKVLGSRNTLLKIAKEKEKELKTRLWMEEKNDIFQYYTSFFH